MADSRRATRGHARLELHWNATYTPGMRQAIVEELDEDGNDEADRRSASADTTNVSYGSKSMNGSTRTRSNFSPTTRQPATTASRVGKDKLAKKLKTHSNLADGCPSIAGTTDDDSGLDATGVHEPSTLR